MMLWQAQARALPVTVRPFGDETVISYTRRLSEANELAPTAIVRALGAMRIGSGRHLLTTDAWLNDHALERLETYSGISRDRLRRALPALRWGLPPSIIKPLPDDVPGLHVYRGYPPPRPACPTCSLRATRDTHPAPILVRPTTRSLVCATHRRWLGNAWNSPSTTHHDISPAPEILTSHRRYLRLHLSAADPDWTRRVFHQAWNLVTCRWANEYPHPWRRPYLDLAPRWHTRAERLDLPSSVPNIPAVVTFPEAVALAELFTDLNWRRHVAMVSVFDLDRFYRRVALRLGCPPAGQPWLLADPIKSWVDSIRGQYKKTRDGFVTMIGRLPAYSTVPYPEIGHFK